MAAVSDMPLFDDFGRCLPGAVQSPALPRSRRYFTLLQPKIDYVASHARLLSCLGAGTTMDAATFEARAASILSRLESDPRTAAIARGVAVPFVLPRLVIDDMGRSLDQRFLPAVREAFENTASPITTMVSWKGARRSSRNLGMHVWSPL